MCRCRDDEGYERAVPVSGAELTRRIAAGSGGGLQHYIYTIHTIHLTLYTIQYTASPSHVLCIAPLVPDPPPKLGDQAALPQQLALQTVQPRPAVLVLGVVPVQHTLELVRAGYTKLKLGRAG